MKTKIEKIKRVKTMEKIQKIESKEGATEIGNVKKHKIKKLS